MRIVVTGDKDWSCPDLAARILRRLVARYGCDIAIIHGNEPGIDASFAAAGDVRGRLDRLDRRDRPAPAEGLAGGARAAATSVGP
jgi:YspA, cpYpsA-related SLOG family